MAPLSRLPSPGALPRNKEGHGLEQRQGGYSRTGLLRCEEGSFIGRFLRNCQSLHFLAAPAVLSFCKGAVRSQETQTEGRAGLCGSSHNPVQWKLKKVEGWSGSSHCYRDAFLLFRLLVGVEALPCHPGVECLDWGDAGAGRRRARGRECSCWFLPKDRRW